MHSKLEKRQLAQENLLRPLNDIREEEGIEDQLFAVAKLEE